LISGYPQEKEVQGTTGKQSIDCVKEARAIAGLLIYGQILVVRQFLLPFFAALDKIY
jgi:hypothetical protein